MQDPFLWIDPKTGAFHVISHAYPGGTDSVLPYDYGDTVGGHSFSADGLKWIWSTTPPFTRYVETAGKNRTSVCNLQLVRFGFILTGCL